VTDATDRADLEMRDTAARVVGEYRASMERLHLDEALAAMMSLAHAANGYAEGQAPWSLHKAGDTERVGQVLAVMAEACRIVGHLLAPVAPRGARRAHDQLGVPVPYDERGAGGPGLDVLTAWGAGPADWHTAAPEPIFPRVDAEALV
jgi:methionyl-tRNA synthetase